MLGKNAKFDEVLNALIAPLKNLLDKKIKGVETEIADINTALADLEKGTIKVLTELVNLWELETGIYYLNGGFNFTATEIIDAGKHILIIYKPQPTTQAVRYIHFCNSLSSPDWYPIECGYTDGTNHKEYDIIDTSKVTGDISGDFLGNKIPNTAGVKTYVKEQLGVIDNGLY